MTQKKNHALRATLVAVFATTFEWYDYALFGYFASIIAKQFFPSTNELSSLLSTFAVFATGFAMRPLGAIIFGHIGDKLGRKAALVLSLLLMSVPTACIGLLPTYQDIGIAATILLVLVRLIQGVAVGGNYGGSVIFAVEHASPNSRGLVGSWSIFSGIVGILLGSATATLFSWIFDEPTLQAWGWRIPFVLGLAVVFVGFYVRRHVPETPKFVENYESFAQQETPIKYVLKNYTSRLVKAIGVVLLHDLAFYVLFVFMTTYMTTILKMPMSFALTLNTVSMIVMLMFIPFFAWASDKVGRKPVMIASAVLLLLLPYPIFWSFGQEGFLFPILAQMTLAIIKAAYIGPLPTSVVEFFPTQGRFTATALSLNISAAAFGGTAPMVATWLIDVLNDQLAPAYYLMAAAIISLVALFFMKDLAKKPLDS